MKISDYIADFLVRKGVKDVFMITGGGAMHMNDSFGHHPELRCTYNHNEQATGMMAEAYGRLTNRPAAVCITAGPGAVNAMAGVYGAYVDSIPMIVFSGQAKRETMVTASDVPLRQLGDQEAKTIDAVKCMTKFAYTITNPNEIRYQLEKAWFLANNGRKGPVWLDVPLDIQAATVYTDELTGFDETNTKKIECPYYDNSYTDKILEKIHEARRPVILAGEGIRQGDAYKEFLECTNSLKIPVVLAWNANDLLWEENSYFAGMPGTVGTRGGNFVVQNADLLIVLGCRMNLRIISYNKLQFAKDAYKIMVDIDKNELYKPTIKIDMPIHADVKDVCRSLANCVEEEVGNHSEWLAWCRNINKRYPAVLPEYSKVSKPMNPYPFIRKVSEQLGDRDVITCGNGAACVQTFQAFHVKKGERIFTNSGSAAMGYGYPAAIGAAVALKGERVVCFDGDGSFMMNVQELATAAYNKLNIKLFLLNNNGYHSIRQTQTNLFHGRPYIGIDSTSGVGFPDFEKLADAFGVKYVRIDSLDDADEKITEVLKAEGPVFCEAIVDPKQNFEPKLSSKVMPDGTITSAECDDMSPFLPKEEYQAIKEEAQNI